MNLEINDTYIYANTGIVSGEALAAGSNDVAGFARIREALRVS